MNRSKRKYSFRLEIIGAFLALCAGFIGLGVDLLKIPFVAYLPVILGFLITTTLSLLKVELLERIDENSKIPSLLNQIENEKLHKRGVEIIRECEHALEDLSRGIIQGRPGELYKELLDRTNSTRHLLQATHLAVNPSDMFIWEDYQGTVNYYRANLQALKRGVTIERLFLLWRKDVIDNNTGKVINQRVLSIMQEQHKSGVEVFVTWLESIVSRESAEDFIIFDDQEVIVNFPIVDQTSFKMLILCKPLNIRTYKNRFAELKALGQPLSQLSVV